jgi:hypothetical protein
MRVLLKIGAVRMEEVTCGDAALRVEGDAGEAVRCSPQREEERGFRGGGGEQKTAHIWAAPEPVRSCIQFLIPMFGSDFALIRQTFKNCEQYKISVIHV